MYLLLHRALRNAGDALIFERGRRLIETFRPTEDLAFAEGWHPLAEQLPAALLRAARAVIVVGGPGYGNGLAGRYPLGLDPERDPPLIFLALGSAIVPGTAAQLASFRFDAPSRSFLDAIAARSAYLGARDRLTAGILERNGFERVLMTGDPAWYDLEQLDAPQRRPSAIGRLAFTPPANPVFFDQAIRVARALAAAFPGASGSVVHHRGVQRPFVALATELGWEDVDITGSADGFAHFDSVDLHVGYRVHAHLYAISHGIPTYLVAEDSRGLGMLQTLGPLGLTGFSERADGPLHRLAMRHLPRLANAYRPLTHRLGRPISVAFRMPDVAGPLMERIRSDLAAGFPGHEAARGVMRNTLPTMRSMIESLP
jgi:hypothetical protein